MIRILHEEARSLLNIRFLSSDFHSIGPSYGPLSHLSHFVYSHFLYPFRFYGTSSQNQTMKCEKYNIFEFNRHYNRYSNWHIVFG